MFPFTAHTPSKLHASSISEALVEVESSKVESAGGVVNSVSKVVPWVEEALECEETLWLGEEFAPARDEVPLLVCDFGRPGGTKDGGRREAWFELRARRLVIGW